VEQTQWNEDPALAEPVGGGAQQRAGEGRADAGDGGVQPAEGHRIALGDDQGEQADDHHRERQARDERDREVGEAGVPDERGLGESGECHDLGASADRACRLDPPARPAYR
jgi:hypothetical protein